jgi:3-oxoacyl-[acyl-carrier-protein] synthase-3
MMLESSGIEYRHYAIDPETHRLTHTSATLAEEAARQALEAAGKKPDDVDLLLLSCPMFDRATPPTSTLLQERLGIEECAEMEIHSNCSGVGKMVQVAFDALRLGRYKTALVAYPQLSSVYLRSCYFSQRAITKKQAALRYILADGAGAVLVEGVESDDAGPIPHEVLATYVESCGGKREPGMTAGGGLADLIDPEIQIARSAERGAHHLDQDFTAVSRHAGLFLDQGVLRMLEPLGLKLSDIDHFVYSIPGRQLYEANLKRAKAQFGIRDEQVKFRATRTGYCGGASILLHFDEVVRSGELKPGQTAVVYAVESSKWMSGGFVVRW